MVNNKLNSKLYGRGNAAVKMLEFIRNQKILPSIQKTLKY